MESFAYRECKESLKMFPNERPLRISAGAAQMTMLSPTASHTPPRYLPGSHHLCPLQRTVSVFRYSFVVFFQNWNLVAACLPKSERISWPPITRKSQVYDEEGRYLRRVGKQGRSLNPNELRQYCCPRLVWQHMTLVRLESRCVPSSHASRHVVLERWVWKIQKTCARVHRFSSRWTPVAFLPHDAMSFHSWIIIEQLVTKRGYWGKTLLVAR